MADLKTEYVMAQASPGFMLWQITNIWQSEQRKALLPFGLTHVQFVLLASLVWSSDNVEISQKQLALHAKTDVMMTSQVVRTLEKKDLLARKTSETDRRVVLLSPTREGTALVNKAVKVVEDVDKQFFGNLGPAVSSFTKMMQQLAR